MATENNDTEQTGTKPKTAIVTQQKAASTSGRKLASFIALSVAIVALVLSTTNYIQIKETVTRDVIDQFDYKLDNLLDANKVVEVKQNQINTLIGELSQKQQQNTKTLIELYELQPGDTSDWVVAEIEHLIVIAIHRLVLERDVNSALTAMQVAKNRLSTLGDPALEVIRNQLDIDVLALQSVEIQDISDLSLFLTDLVTRVDTLSLQTTPFISEQDESKEIEEEYTVWEKLKAGVWAEIKNMFVIVRTGEGVKAKLLPDESYFLVQNLRLQLETARFAIFRRDTRSFQVSIELAIEWLKEYFNQNDKDVLNTIETLDVMKSIDIEPQLPNLNSSLEVVRDYINDQMATKLPDSGSELR